MSTYVKIRAGDKNKYSSIDEAVKAIYDSITLEVYDTETDDLLETQTITETCRGDDYVYYRWYVTGYTINEGDEDGATYDADILIDGIDSEKEAVKLAKDLPADIVAKYDDICVEHCPETLYEHISDDSIEKISIK